MNSSERRIPEYETHGWVTLVSWFPLGFALIATKRYYKTQWFLMHHMHSFVGLLVVLATLWTCLGVYSHVGWELSVSTHAILGLIALVMTLFVGISGLITAFMMQCYDGEKSWAERDKVYKVARVHRYSSYLMLLLGNGVCSGGIATYFSKIGYGIWGTFGVCSSIFFLLMVGLHEFLMRRYNRRNFKLIEGDKLLDKIGAQDLRSWTPLEIEQAVEGGDTLVICDNLVLRTDGYEKIHPGGKFTIRKNFGRDIAKFYYGNYALTNGRLTTPHTHSGQANDILHNMIIGVIED